MNHAKSEKSIEHIIQLYFDSFSKEVDLKCHVDLRDADILSKDVREIAISVLPAEITILKFYMKSN